MAIEWTDPETNETKVVCGWPLANGSVCKRYPSSQNGMCKEHGKVGVQLAQHNAIEITARNSRYSGVLTKELLDFDSAAEMDADFYGLSPEIRVIDARTRQLLASLPEDTLAEKLDAIIEKMDELITLFSNADVPTLEVVGRSMIKDLQSLIATIRDDRMTWQDILTVIDSRRKLVESERKRAIEAQQIITQKQAALLMQLLLDIINRHIQDPGVKNAIAADITRLADDKAINRAAI